MKKITILLAVLLVLATSCSKQEDAANVNVNEATPEIQATPTPTTVPEITPTITPTPKKAENFENCLTMRFNSTYESDIYGSNTQGDLITENDVVHDVSSWKINKDGVVTEITNPQVTDGLVYFSINGVKVTMTEGAILYIELYKDPPSYDTAYILAYSPTTNKFILLDWSQPQPYPIISINIYPDSTVSLTNIGGITHTYQGNYCVEQNNGSANIAHKELNDEQCVIYTLPNGDEYGYGVNKNGEVSCMQLWMEDIKE